MQNLSNKTFSKAGLFYAVIFGVLLDLNACENPGSAGDDFTGPDSEEEGAYRFDVTMLVENILRNGLPQDREFFVTLVNNGVVKSSIDYV